MYFIIQGGDLCLEWKVCGRISDRCIENQENVQRELLVLLQKNKSQRYHSTLPGFIANGVYIIIIMYTLNNNLNKI